jgi:hypothetical protein
MKRLFYFVLLLVGVSAIHSCKELLDEDGNPLLDINNTTGLTGPRALYREITDSDTLATYYYNGLHLSRVLTDSASTADVSWSGDKVSTLDFKGFLDLDHNGKMDKDSIIFTQLFTYGNTGRLESISENRSFFHRITTAPYSVAAPSPQLLYRKVKTIYNLQYAAATAKLDSITMRSGPEVAGIPAFDNYSRTKFEYLGDNVSKTTKHFGAMNSSGALGTPTKKLSYEYTNYDVKISPFTLLPNAYKISRLLSSDIYIASLTTPYIITRKDYDNWILSPNSPKRLSITDLMQVVPAPNVFSTDYNYDPQTYMQKGFGINYIYKPL